MASNVYPIAPADENFHKTEGKVAFEAAYSFLECHGKGPNGEDLLRWSQLSPEMQDAWQAAANAVRDMEKQKTLRLI